MKAPSNVIDPITVRAAEERDFPALCRLYVDFHEFHVRGVPDRLKTLGDPSSFDPSALVQELEKILTNPNATILVAERDGEVSGLAEIYIRCEAPEALRFGRRFALLQSLMVRDADRRSGIGARLVKAAEEWAGNRHVSELRVETWEFAEGPLAFYEKQGYQTLKRTLIKRLKHRTE